MIEDLAREHGGFSFGKLNVDENREDPVRFGIMSIPTLLYFKDGSLIDKTIGALPKEAVENRLNRILA